MSQPGDWITGKVKDRDINEAKAIREERDRLYGNIFPERDTDSRWVGEVGEICFNRWLKNHDVGHSWFQGGEVTLEPDFRVGRFSVDLKTTKRSGPVLPHYTMQVTASHVAKAQHFFFAGFNTTTQELTLLGGIDQPSFRALSVYFGPGEKVHNNYWVHEGHEIYNIAIAHLYAPLVWLDIVSHPLGEEYDERMSWLT